MSLTTLLAQGRAKFEARDFAGAHADFAAARQLAPADPEVLARLAACCAELADWPAAAATWSELLAQHPDLAVALAGLGIALREQGRYTEAVAHFARVTVLQPNLAAGHFNLGTCLLHAGRPADGVAPLRAAIALDPTSGDARFNLALALLKSGAFKTGALAYEARWKSEWRGKERPFTTPRWTGQPLAAGESLLLWGEQGIGDEIMFAGLLSEAHRAAAGPVCVECAPRLVPLFARSFPSVRVVARTDPPAAGCATATLHAPLGALPALFWPASRAPEPPAAFLQADPASVTVFRARLAALGPGRKIGVAWRGGHPAAQRPRLVPAGFWRALLTAEDFVPVCLQHGDTDDAIAASFRDAGRPLVRFPDVDPLVDMDRFAALIGVLDAVISVDNSTVHLAGALGAPTLVLLSADSDWRWGVDGVPCPWYRSVRRAWLPPDGQWTDLLSAASGLGCAP